MTGTLPTVQDVMKNWNALMLISDDCVTEDGGRLNLYAKEPPMTIMDVTETHNEKAEKLNGRLAMLGVMAALGAYALTGQVSPVVW